MAESVNFDQTAAHSLIWVCAVCISYRYELQFLVGYNTSIIRYFSGQAPWKVSRENIYFMKFFLCMSMCVFSFFFFFFFSFFFL